MTAEEKLKRTAILHDFKLEGQYCVTFREIEGDSETLSFRCYPTEPRGIPEHNALLAISLFEHRDIWKELAKT